MTSNTPLQPRSASDNNSPRRLVFVNRFYYPDSSATSQILTDVAEVLAKKGHSVSVFSSRLSYDGRTTHPAREKINEVEVRRVWSTSFGRDTNIGRAIDYVTFYFSIFAALVFAISRGDILIAKTDPPMLSVPLGIVARVKRAHLVNWLQDIFPEVAIRLGMGSPRGTLIKIAKALRNRSLRHARMNVVIGTRMSEFVRDLNIQPERISVIENFVDDESIKRTTKLSPELRKQWNLKDSDFVVGYSGNLGRAHDLDTILDAAELLRTSPEIKFLFIGSGFQYERILKEAERRGLENVILKPYQPRARLNESLSLPNLHWASLAPNLEGLIVPSKLYGIAAAGKPLLMIGDPNGEIGRLLCRSPFGMCVPPGSSQKVRNFIVSIKEDSELSVSMGKKARSFIDLSASRRIAVDKWDALFRTL